MFFVAKIHSYRYIVQTWADSLSTFFCSIMTALLIERDYITVRGESSLLILPYLVALEGASLHSHWHLVSTGKDAD